MTNIPGEVTTPAETPATESAPSLGSGVAPQPTPSDIVNDTTGQADWKSLLSEDLRNDPSIKDFKGVDELAKAQINLKRMMGSEKVPIPKEGESWDDFYRAAGRPEDAAGYELTVPDEMSAAQTATVESFKAAAHTLGLQPQQAEGLNKWFAEFNAKAAQEQNDLNLIAEDETRTLLQQKWGVKADRELNTANRAVKALGGDGLLQKFSNAGLSNDMDVIMLFNKVGKMMQEDNQLVQGPASMVQTREQVQTELDAVLNDPAYHAGDPRLVEKQLEIRSRLNNL